MTIDCNTMFDFAHNYFSDLMVNIVSLAFKSNKAISQYKISKSHLNH